MDRTKLGVVAAIATLAVPAVAPAQTFAELLEPIPNAAQRLQLAPRDDAAPLLIEARYVSHHHHHHAPPRHHHHHARPVGHHHHYVAPVRHHHHHVAPVRHHHHHHHLRQDLGR
jgi:hypothetical protein